MTLVKSHINPDKSKRYAKPSSVNGSVFLNPQYKKAELLIEECYVDICNGCSRSDVVQKLMDGIYESSKGKKYCYSQAQNYWKAAMNRFEYDAQLSKEEIRDVLLGRYNSVYQDAIEMGDRNAAIRVLDSLSKIAGLFENNKPTTAVQINSNDKEVTINFGFNDENKL